MLRLPFVLSAMLLFSPIANSQLFEVTGHSAIIDGNTEQAREQAIERALSQVALQGNASLNYQEQIQQGILTEQNLAIAGQIQIDNVEIINERRINGQIYVTLQVETAPILQAQCQRRVGKVALTIPRAQIRHREQLSQGAIYDIDDAFSRLIGNMLSGEGQHTLGQYRSHIQVPNHNNHSLWAQTLGREDHSQYILALQFEDLTLEQPKPLLGYWEQDGTRHFAYHARLIDAFNGQTIWQQRYRDHGAWPFARNAQVNLSSERFWQSPFGQSLQHSARQLVSDLDKRLACEPLKGRIIQLEGALSVIDLGSNHGLQRGDYLILVPQQHAWGQPSRQQLLLESVEADQARARLLGSANQIGVQLGDWVYKEPEPN